MWIDVFVWGLCVVSCLIGLFRGVFREIFSLVALAISVSASIFLGGMLYPHLLGSVPNEWMARLISYSVVFLIPYVAFSFIIYLLRKKLIEDNIGLADHLLGGAFGFLRAAIALALGAFFLVPYVPDSSAFLEESITWPYLTQMASIMGDITPAEILTSYRERQVGLMNRVLKSPEMGAIIRDPEIFKKAMNRDLSDKEMHSALTESVDREALARILQQAQVLQEGGKAPTDARLDVQSMEALLQMINTLPDVSEIEPPTRKASELHEK